MEVLPAVRHRLFASLSSQSDGKAFEPDTEAIKQRLLRKGVFPTPKILHNLRKKEIQKSIRRSKKLALKEETFPLSESQKKALEDDALFRKAASEYRAVMSELDQKREQRSALSGMPWKRASGIDIIGVGSEREDFTGKKLKSEHLEDLRRLLAERNKDTVKWFLDEDDVEEIEGVAEDRRLRRWHNIERMKDDEKIHLLARRLSSANLSIQDWKFSRLMKHSGLLFSEMCMLDIIEELGSLRSWRQAISVVKWVYNQQEYKHCKSRFVYTKLLSVLSKERRPNEALKIFNEMREDGQIYPDMAAYHSIANTLGQAGLVEALILVIDCMRQKPARKLKNMKRRNWDPCLEPDIIIYNSILNACIPSHQWKGVSWVLKQMRCAGLKLTETTYGLAMEVMLKAGKYELVHKFFEKMQQGRLAPKALSYKVLVRTFWEEGKIDQAIAAVRDMERRGVVGTPSVYYELACCLCNKGMWLDATMEVEKLKRLPHRKPLEVAFTGMILASLDGGYIDNCTSIFEYMKDHCTPNIGTINALLKAYGCGDMFAKAKKLFESVKGMVSVSNGSAEVGSLEPDAFTYTSMLVSSASACQWEYFEYVYKEMALSGYKLELNRHSWLLVEASKAGKWHILEHAFDTTLESGEIPHSSLFTEMLCQAIIQQDFRRSTPLLNAMALACMKVSERQWTNLFKRNKDRFSKQALQNLLNHLHECKPVMESPIPDLLRSLESLCGEGKSTASIAVGEEDEDGEICDDHPDLQVKGKPMESIWRDGNENLERVSAIELECNTSCSDSVLHQLTVELGNPYAGAPSASDILRSWKEQRSKLKQDNKLNSEEEKIVAPSTQF